MRGNLSSEFEEERSGGRKNSSGGSSRDPYSINYEDSRFTDIEAQKNDALSNLDETYGNMIKDSDSYFQSQIDASKDWADKQSQIQQEQTDFAIEQIEQQKEQAQKDYTKEQSGAFVDWQKQSDEYGAEAEQRAAQGLSNTGFSESSKVSMFNTYQNRVSAAREAYSRAVQNYDNAITQAVLSNNSVLAEIAYNALQTELSLALQGFQYKNQLILDLSNKKLEVDSLYYTRWHDVLEQMNTENALAEQIRQFNASLAEEQRQFDYYADGGSGSSGGGGSGSISAASALANMSNRDRAAYEAAQSGSSIITSDMGHEESVRKENIILKNAASAAKG